MREWICDKCSEKKALCHLTCEEFKRETKKSVERQRRIKLAMKAERDMDTFAFEVHENGKKYERMLRTRGSRH